SQFGTGRSLDSNTPNIANMMETFSSASLWFVTALWLVQSILAFLRLYHSHKQHITGPWLHRDKELLLGHSPTDSGSPTPPLPPATPTVYV
ncbi:hypothetical protein GOODEAATRI_012026, partial [Goodea atripinnis]